MAKRFKQIDISQKTGKGVAIYIKSNPDAVVLERDGLTRRQLVNLISHATDNSRYQDVWAKLRTIGGKETKNMIFDAICALLNFSQNDVRDFLSGNAKVDFSQEDCYRLFFVNNGLLTSPETFYLALSNDRQSLVFAELPENARREITNSYSSQLQVTVPKISLKVLRTNRAELNKKLEECDYYNILPDGMAADYLSELIKNAVKSSFSGSEAHMYADHISKMEIPPDLITSANAIVMNGDSYDLAKLLVMVGIDAERILYNAIRGGQDISEDGAIGSLSLEFSQSVALQSLLTYHLRQEDPKWATKPEISLLLAPQPALAQSLGGGSFTPDGAKQALVP